MHWVTHHVCINPYRWYILFSPVEKYHRSGVLLIYWILCYAQRSKQYGSERWCTVTDFITPLVHDPFDKKNVTSFFLKGGCVFYVCLIFFRMIPELGMQWSVASPDSRFSFDFHYYSQQNVNLNRAMQLNAGMLLSMSAQYHKKWPILHYFQGRI